MSLKGLLIALSVALVCFVGGIALLGIPGALLFELFKPLMRLVFGAQAVRSLAPDSAWPIALFVSMLWPLGIVLAYLVCFGLFGKLSRAGKAALFAGTLLVWSGIVSSTPFWLG